MYPDMKSYTGSTLIMGFGVMSSSSTNQKVHLISSTGEESISVDEKIRKLAWSKRFAEDQGLKLI